MIKINCFKYKLNYLNSILNNSKILIYQLLKMNKLMKLLIEKILCNI